MKTESVKLSYSEIGRYKYELADDLTVNTGILGHSISEKYIQLDDDGWLKINTGYWWDGPSGPTIDTKDFMRGALAHDALYQLMRLGALGQEYRKAADKVLYKLCRADGMSWLRAGYVYRAVRRFAIWAAKPGTQPSKEITTIAVGGAE